LCVVFPIYQPMVDNSNIILHTSPKNSITSEQNHDEI
jgi:hypothetical protein